MLTLNVNVSYSQGPYLGLPSFIGANRCRAFQFLKDRVVHKLFSWGDKLLSKGGKKVVLKAVVQ